jgi:hypothetical protein
MKFFNLMAAAFIVATPASASVPAEKSYGPKVFSNVPQAPKNISIPDSNIRTLRMLEGWSYDSLKAFNYWEKDWTPKGKTFGYCHYSPMSGVGGMWLLDINAGISAVFSRDCGTADRSQIAISCGNIMNGNNPDLVSSNYGNKQWSSWEIPGAAKRNGKADAEFVADVCFYAP